MIVKFFKTPESTELNGDEHINYSLKVKRGGEQAEIIKGDPKETASIINAMAKTQNKALCGSINFAHGEKPTEQEIAEIIADFEKMISGDRANEFNFLWIAHSDKQHYHIHFTIPNYNLKEFRNENIYIHKLDFTKRKAWKELTRLKYNLTDPNDLEHKRLIKGGDHEKKRERKTREKEQEFIIKQIEKGLIQSRDDIIAYYTAQGFEVNRKGFEKDKATGKKTPYLSFKKGKEKFRITGVIADDEFTNLEFAQREIAKRASEQIADERLQSSNKRKQKVIKRYREFISKCIENRRNLARYTKRAESRAENSARTGENISGTQNREPESAIAKNTAQQRNSRAESGNKKRSKRIFNKPHHKQDNFFGANKLYFGLCYQNLFRLRAEQWQAQRRRQKMLDFINFERAKNVRYLQKRAERERERAGAIITAISGIFTIISTICDEFAKFSETNKPKFRGLESTSYYRRRWRWQLARELTESYTRLEKISGERPSDKARVDGGAESITQQFRGIIAFIKGNKDKIKAKIQRAKSERDFKNFVENIDFYIETLRKNYVQPFHKANGDAEQWQFIEPLKKEWNKNIKYLKRAYDEKLLSESGKYYLKHIQEILILWKDYEPQKQPTNYKQEVANRLKI